MRIKDVMTSPVVMVGPDRHLEDAARQLFQLRIGAVPVVDGTGRLIGLLSEADLVGLDRVEDPRAHALPSPAAGAERVPVTVSELMTTDVTTLCEDDDVADAARLMATHGHRSIPVLAGSWVVGIVTRHDLLEMLARSDEDIRSELTALLDEPAFDDGPYSVDVGDGVVTLIAPPDPARRRLPELLTRIVPGVVGLRFADDNVMVAR